MFARSLLAVCLLAVWGTYASAQQLSAGPDTVEPLPPVTSAEDVSEIGRGPTDETRELEADKAARTVGMASEEPTLLERWYGLKGCLKTEHNFEFGLAYTATYQQSSEDIIGGARGVGSGGNETAEAVDTFGDGFIAGGVADAEMTVSL